MAKWDSLLRMWEKTEEPAATKKLKGFRNIVRPGCSHWAVRSVEHGRVVFVKCLTCCFCEYTDSVLCALQNTVHTVYCYTLYTLYTLCRTHLSSGISSRKQTNLGNYLKHISGQQMQSDAIAGLYISRQQTKSCDTMADVTHIAKPEKLKIVFLRAFVPVMKCALGWSGI